MPTRKRLCIAPAMALVMILSAAGASAQTSDDDAGKVMQDLDKRIGEFERMRAAPGGEKGVETLFEFLDENGDGVIDRTEWDIRKMRIFTARDRNGDQKLSPADLPALGPEAFAAADTNGDGFIDGLEFNQAHFMGFDHGRSRTGPIDFTEFQEIMQRLGH